METNVPDTIPIKKAPPTIPKAIVVESENSVSSDVSGSC